MRRESKNPVTGSPHRAALILIVFLLFTYVLLNLVLWSYESVRRTGELDNIASWLRAMAWLPLAFSTPLCPPDARLLLYMRNKQPYVLLIAALLCLMFYLTARRRGNYVGVEHGSSHWATRRERRPFREPRGAADMPLAEGVYLTDAAKPANRNVFVLAPPGGGKSFTVIIPAIEAATRPGRMCSFVCTDTKGALFRDTSEMVRERGFKTYLLNFSDPWYTNCYNPLFNVHADRKFTEIAELALSYVKNIRDEEAGVGDAIWEDTFRALMSAVWMYQFDYTVNPLTGKPETRAMWRTAELICGIRIDAQGQISNVCELHRIVNAVRKQDPLHPSVSSYDFVMSGAPETVASVVFTAGSKISMFTYPEIEALTMKNEIPIDRIMEEPSAVYINFAIGSPYRAIAALFLEQVFKSAYYIAETKYDGVLPLELKMLLDELPNLCKIYSLPERLSTSRSYGIDIVLSVQSMQQVERMFQKAEKTILNNCATHIYLGSGEQDALKQISEMLGKTTTVEESYSRSVGTRGGSGSDSEKALGRELILPAEMRTMPDKYSVVVMQHHSPIFTEKFKTQKRKWYPLLGGRGNRERSANIKTAYLPQRALHETEYKKIRAARTAALMEKEQ